MLSKIKSFSLLEMVFVIVIIGLLSSVIPKIFSVYQIANKQSIRDEGILSSVSILNIVKNLQWDEQLGLENDIMIPSHGNPIFQCDGTGTNHRPYSFQNSRGCWNNLDPLPIGPEPNETNLYYYDDIDDFHNIETYSERNGTKIYTINVNVKYIEDTFFNYDYTNRKITIDENDITETTNPTNIKKINIWTKGQYRNGEDYLITNDNYYSSNIGKVIIGSQEWN